MSYKSQNEGVKLNKFESTKLSVEVQMRDCVAEAK